MNSRIDLFQENYYDVINLWEGGIFLCFYFVYAKLAIKKQTHSMGFFVMLVNDETIEIPL